MPSNPDRRRVQVLLERCGRDIAEHVGSLDALYEERNALYAEGLGLGMTKVQLAAWARSTPDAVAKAVAKLSA